MFHFQFILWNEVLNLDQISTFLTFAECMCSLQKAIKMVIHGWKIVNTIDVMLIVPDCKCIQVHEDARKVAFFYVPISWVWDVTYLVKVIIVCRIGIDINFVLLITLQVIQTNFSKIVKTCFFPCKLLLGRD